MKRIAALLLGALVLTGCTSQPEPEPEQTPTQQPQTQQPQPPDVPVPRDDGEYAPADVDVLDADAATAARQFVLSFYGWDSRTWNTADYPSGRQIVGEPATRLMTDDFNARFDADGLIPYGVPANFNAEKFRNEGRYVETIHVTAYADEHLFTETSAIWSVDTKLNIVSEDEEEGITRSQPMHLPVTLELVRKTTDDPWLIDGVGAERSW